MVDNYTSPMLSHMISQQKILFPNGDHLHELVQIYNPLRMWILQFGIIIVVTQIISFPLKRIHQPKVIAEVMGGIILSPSILGRIPGFTNAVFPDESKSYLTLVANIGIILFLFLVGLEIDGEVIKRNARLSMSIAVAGMIIPFCMGSAFSIAIYNQFIDNSIPLAHFLLFVGVAFSITAFPILCRILTELNLLDTTVGIVVLSAGVANDVVGWCLLAFSTALANSDSSLAALHILLPCIGWSLFLLFPMRRVLHWLAHKTGSMTNGPTLFFTTCTLLMVFSSALVTDMIGVHAIFGSFLAGLIVPRKNGLAVALTEKLEDTVSIILLPLYFTLSGLSTDFGLLNDGITWAFTLGIILVAWSGKFGGCAVAARLSGFHWREAASIGTLMSCKGLVELIVLNIGLSAGILNTRVFSMFVLEALFLTFMTTPVVVKIYPPAYRDRNAFSKASRRINGSDATLSYPEINSFVDPERKKKTRFMLVLDQAKHLPSSLSIIPLLRQRNNFISAQDHVADNNSDLERGGASSITPSDFTVNVLRLVQLSDRVSDVMKSTMAYESLVQSDPILNVFKASCRTSNISTTASLSLVPFEDFAQRISEYATETLSQLTIIPWLFPHSNVAAPAMHEFGKSLLESSGLSPSLAELSSSDTPDYQFFRDVFSSSKTDIALFIDREQGETWQYDGHHLLLPFLGGPDDRLALLLVAQLCSNTNTTATIFRLDNNPEDHTETMVNSERQENEGPGRNGGNDENYTVSPTIYNSKASSVRTLTAQVPSPKKAGSQDTLLWNTFTSDMGVSSLSPALRDAITRMTFVEEKPPTNIKEILVQLQNEVVTATRQRTRPFIFVGRRRCPAAASSSRARTQNMGWQHTFGDDAPASTSELRATIGDLGARLTQMDNSAGLVVVQTPL